jgi:hypothetical protein
MSLAAAPALARADGDVVATAAGAPSSPSDTSGSPLTRWLGDEPPATSAGGGDSSDIVELGPDQRVHGEVGFGVGTGGYREGYAAVTMPIGKSSQLGVAIDDTQFGRPWRYDAKSLAVDLQVGTVHAAADCDAAVRVGDRYYAPLWVGQFRDRASNLLCETEGPSRR